MDQQVSLHELSGHVRALAAAVDVPISVDAENCYAATPSEVAETVVRLAEEGAAGLSIEDFDPAFGIYPLPKAVERVAAAAEASRRNGVVLTARAENYLYDINDFEDTVIRLTAFRDAGADVVYAPGLRDLRLIARLVEEVGVPLNVLLLRDGPTVGELAGVGVRRVSVGGALAFAAYGALASAARELLASGTSTYLERALSPEDRSAAFGNA
jgi:2-methylisocitrate lyase-like PEP mutase family enzyme